MVDLHWRSVIHTPMPSLRCSKVAAFSCQTKLALGLESPQHTTPPARWENHPCTGPQSLSNRSCHPGGRSQLMECATTAYLGLWCPVIVHRIQSNYNAFPTVPCLQCLLSANQIRLGSAHRLYSSAKFLQRSRIPPKGHVFSSLMHFGVSIIQSRRKYEAQKETWTDGELSCFVVLSCFFLAARFCFMVWQHENIRPMPVANHLFWIWRSWHGAMIQNCQATCCASLNAVSALASSMSPSDRQGSNYQEARAHEMSILYINYHKASHSWMHNVEWAVGALRLGFLAFLSDFLNSACKSSSMSTTPS